MATKKATLAEQLKELRHEIEWLRADLHSPNPIAEANTQGISRLSERVLKLETPSLAEQLSQCEHQTVTSIRLCDARVGREILLDVEHKCSRCGAKREQYVWLTQRKIRRMQKKGLLAKSLVIEQ